jgi:hypothetical protein
MYYQIQIRRGTASEWTAANSILAAGEIAFESDTNKMKVGNGSTAWNSLAYFPNIDSGAITTALGYTPSSTGKSIAMAIVFGG